MTRRCCRRLEERVRSRGGVQRVKVQASRVSPPCPAPSVCVVLHAADLGEGRACMQRRFATTSNQRHRPFFLFFFFLLSLWRLAVPPLSMQPRKRRLLRPAPERPSATQHMAQVARRRRTN